MEVQEGLPEEKEAPRQIYPGYAEFPRFTNQQTKGALGSGNGVNLATVVRYGVPHLNGRFFAKKSRNRRWPSICALRFPSAVPPRRVTSSVRMLEIRWPASG